MDPVTWAEGIPKPATTEASGKRRQQRAVCCLRFHGPVRRRHFQAVVYIGVEPENASLLSNSISVDLCGWD